MGRDLSPVAVSRRAWVPPTAARVAGLRRRLRAVYGAPVQPPHGDPLAELVLTVLSQSTNDRNRDVAYLRLRAALPTWEQVRDAPVAEVEEAIRPGGISRVKSARIQEQLRGITTRAAADEPTPRQKGSDPFWRWLRAQRDAQALPARGPRSASGVPGPLGSDPFWRFGEGLRVAPLAVARAELTALPGVGRKTAACVLLFALGRDDCPVDTHVGRVGTRLGLLRPGAGLDEAHDAMAALKPRGAALELHVNLLRHGRRTCAAQHPRCDACALRRGCPQVGLAGPGGRDGGLGRGVGRAPGQGTGRPSGPIT